MGMRMWMSGMRPRTLPASIAPVIVGASAAWKDAKEQMALCASGEGTRLSTRAAWFDCGGSFAGSPSWFWLLVVPCLIVALGLQVAVNFANDYSDGIRGTDAGRTSGPGAGRGPARLVASGVSPRRVLAAAGLAAAVACLAGLCVTIAFGRWWLLAVGIASLIAGWCYTGGRHPYGYQGLGEVFVFVFFGPVATCGVYYAMTGALDWSSGSASATGAVVCGVNAAILLMVNNLRDIEADQAAGKRTLAVKIGAVKALRLLRAALAMSLVGSTLFLATLTMRWGGYELSGALCMIPVLAATLPLLVSLDRGNWKGALAGASLFSLISALSWAVVLMAASGSWPV